MPLDEDFVEDCSYLSWVPPFPDENPIPIVVVECENVAAEEEEADRDDDETKADVDVLPSTNLVVHEKKLLLVLYFCCLIEYHHCHFSIFVCVGEAAVDADCHW